MYPVGTFVQRNSAESGMRDSGMGTQRSFTLTPPQSRAKPWAWRPISTLAPFSAKKQA
jgi:hypothetical protein